jgi:hypothetical protein
LRSSSKSRQKLLREAAALAAREGLAERIEFREGSAEALPLADASIDVALALTVMEEGDADRMMAELMRVTCPGGRIGAIVRAQDMSWWSNLPLNPALRAKVDRAGVLGGGGIAYRLRGCQPLQPILRCRACRSALLPPACLCYARNRADPRWQP